MSKRTLVLPDFVRYFFLLAIVGVLLLFGWIISPFFNVLVYAALVVIVFHPVYDRLLKKFPKHKDIVAFLSALLVILVLLAPLAFFTIFLGQEALSAYALLSTNTWSGLDQSTTVDLVQFGQEIVKSIVTFLITQSSSILGAVGTTVLSIFMFAVTVFFFFRDGTDFVKQLKFLSPLPEKYETEIQNKLRDTVYAIVVGNFGASFLQGIAAGIGFAIAGVDNVILWGTFIVFSALIPYVGAAVVWVPIAIGLMLEGQTVWAIFLTVWGFSVIPLVDNVSHSLLIGRRTKMSSLATFFAVLGGVLIFGPKGIIFGPLILSLTVTILHIYQMEYQDLLKD